MKNNRVNIDRDVQSRKNIAVSRTTPVHREEPQTAEQPKDEPKEEIGEEVKIPEAESENTQVPAPATTASKPKKGARPPEGDA